MEELTINQAIDLICFLKWKSFEVEKEGYVQINSGRCAIGNGIEAPVWFPDEEKVRVIRVFTNHWTEGEQETAIKELLKRCRTFFPEYSHLLKYQSGLRPL